MRRHVITVSIVDASDTAHLLVLRLHGEVASGDPNRVQREVLMLDVVIGRPPVVLMQCAVAAVWLYEGLWCKLLGREPRQREVVAAVPTFGVRYGGSFLLALGVAEVCVAIWVLSGWLPGTCAAAQVVLLVALSSAGVLFARHVIHDPAGMVVKNIAFLVLAWTTAALMTP